MPNLKHTPDEDKASKEEALRKQAEKEAKEAKEKERLEKADYFQRKYAEAQRELAKAEKQIDEINKANDKASRERADANRRKAKADRKQARRELREYTRELKGQQAAAAEELASSSSSQEEVGVQKEKEAGNQEAEDEVLVLSESQADAEADSTSPQRGNTSGQPGSSNPLLDPTPAELKSLQGRSPSSSEASGTSSAMQLGLAPPKRKLQWTDVKLKVEKKRFPTMAWEEPFPEASTRQQVAQMSEEEQEFKGIWWEYQIACTKRWTSLQTLNHNLGEAQNLLNKPVTEWNTQLVDGIKYRQSKFYEHEKEVFESHKAAMEVLHRHQPELAEREAVWIRTLEDILADLKPIFAHKKRAIAEMVESRKEQAKNPKALDPGVLSAFQPAASSVGSSVSQQGQFYHTPEQTEFMRQQMTMFFQNVLSQPGAMGQAAPAQTQGIQSTPVPTNPATGTEQATAQPTQQQKKEEEDKERQRKLKVAREEEEQRERFRQADMKRRQAAKATEIALNQPRVPMPGGPREEKSRVTREEFCDGPRGEKKDFASDWSGVAAGNLAPRKRLAMPLASRDNQPSVPWEEIRRDIRAQEEASGARRKIKPVYGVDEDDDVEDDYDEEDVSNQPVTKAEFARMQRSFEEILKLQLSKGGSDNREDDKIVKVLQGNQEILRQNRLPPTKLDAFTGSLNEDYNGWKKVFQEVHHPGQTAEEHNSTGTLIALQNSLKGEPRRKIKNMPSVDNGYAQAWKILDEHYGGVERAKNKAEATFLALTRCEDKNNTKQMEVIVDHMRVLYRVLESGGLQMGNSLVRLWQKKLPQYYRTKWLAELKQGTDKDDERAFLDMVDEMVRLKKESDEQEESDAREAKASQQAQQSQQGQHGGARQKEKPGTAQTMKATVQSPQPQQAAKPKGYQPKGSDQGSSRGGASAGAAGGGAGGGGGGGGGSRKPQPPTGGSPQKAATMCPACKKKVNHDLPSCPTFRGMTPKVRFGIIMATKRCCQCLAEGHGAKACPKKGQCQADASCPFNHHRMLHR